MKVRAVFDVDARTKFGFYGNARRRNGDEFSLTDKAGFSEKWMEKVNPDDKCWREEVDKPVKKVKEVVKKAEAGAV